MSDSKGPVGDLAIRTMAMPADTNPLGDIFGGWVLSQMDIAGAVVAKKRAQGRTVTAAVDAMSFHKPVFVGDVVCCYASIVKEGRTSLQIHVEVWVTRQLDLESNRIKVTEGRFTYVAVGEDRKPVVMPPARP